MDTVLVRLSGGAGIVRHADGATVVTDDVGEGYGTHLRLEDPFHPVKSWVDDDDSVVGGLLPPGAVRAEVVDDLDRRVDATIGGGAYAAIIAQPNGREEPIVCCRDATGGPVRRPLPAEYPSELVLDSEEPCPACGAVDYAEYVPTEQWRGGRPGPGGVTVPNPVVVCRACGHETPEGTFFAAYANEHEEVAEADREARIARARAEERVQRWYANTMLLRGVTFPIYAVDGWPAQIAGSASRGDTLTEITIGHDKAPRSDRNTRSLPPIEVTTSIDEFQLANELRHARETLEVWAGNLQPQMPWEGKSHAAITLWLAARQRSCRGLALAAERTSQPITLDGAAQPFLTLTTSSGNWVAIRTHHDVMITIAGHSLDPTTLALEPIADPTARLVGLRPQDP